MHGKLKQTVEAFNKQKDQNEGSKTQATELTKELIKVTEENTNLKSQNHQNQSELR
jgi:hypothetical protein